jgi:hypothetical protein
VPATANGCKAATTDAEQIRIWWANSPEASIGIATGGGLVVVDLDGADGIAEFDSLLSKNGGEIGEPLVVATGGGGRHLYYACDDNAIKNRTKVAGKKIDVRASGGFVIAPPSTHISGNVYAWLESNGEPGPMPEWLLVFIKKPTKAPKPATPTAYRPEGDIQQRALAYLEKMPAAVQGQNGSKALMNAARAVVYGFNLGQARGLTLLENYYNPRCQPPWSDRELAHKCADADTKEFGKPRGWLLDTAGQYGEIDDSWIDRMTDGPTTSTGDDDFDLAPREPKPIDRAAFMGLAGEIVDAIEPHTEADPVAILLQLLVSFGSLIGRTAHATVEGTPHYLNLFAVMVGKSSKARKGTSWDRVHQLVAPCDSAWASDRIATGVSSGEGIIAEVRDGNLAAGDEGVKDKRLLLLQSEFAGVLRNLERNGNTVSVVLRDAWDGKQLRTLTRNNALRATGAHISLIGHVTDDELKRLLTQTDVANGFGNRHLFAYVKRSKLLPEGGGDLDILPFADALGKRLAFAQSVGEMRRTQEARELWGEVYGPLSEGGAGIAGALCGRAEAQALRLSCLYALLAGASEVGVDHLQAALALWRYCEGSVRVIFGDAGVIADPVAAKILNALKAAPAGLTQTQINDALGGHVPSEKIRAAMRFLLDGGSVRHETSTTPGRDRRTWFAV